jgi:single-strand DNA-binding protein
MYTRFDALFNPIQIGSGGNMPSLNRVQLIGNLGKDPETRVTTTGKKVSSFSVAVNQHWHSAEGEAKEATEWFTIEAWGKLGEFCQRYLGKGRLVFVEGRLQTDRYEHEGETRYRTKVVASQVQALDRRVETEEEPDLEETLLDE